MIDLLPCPFCGDAARAEPDSEHSTAYTLQHHSKGCPIDDLWDWYPDEEQAIAAWNTRPDLILRAEAEAMVAAALNMAVKIKPDVAVRTTDWRSAALDMEVSYRRAISSLTPADARAALDKMLAEAEARGARKAALAEMQHIGEQIEGAADTEARIAEAVAKERERLTDVDRLAQIIRKVDGSNNIGAAALAEAIAAAIRQTEGEG